LKPERLGSPLVQEKYREEKACDRRQHDGGGGGGDDDDDKGTCVVIDVAVSGDRNVIKKEAEKILKYKDLTTEIQRMWSIK